MIWPGCKLFSRWSLPGPHMSVRRFFFQCKLCETCPRIRQVSWPIDIPVIIDAFFLLVIQIGMSSSGNVNVFQWNREWLFSRRVKFDSGLNVMAVYEVSRHGPKSHLSLHRHPETSLEVVEETLLTLQESQCYSLLELVAAVSRWMFSGLDLLQGFLNRPSAIGIINSPFSLGNITSFALSLFEQISDASIVSNSSRSAISTSPFQIPPAYRAYPRNNPGETFFPNDGFLTGPSQL